VLPNAVIATFGDVRTGIGRLCCGGEGCIRRVAILAGGLHVVGGRIGSL